MHPTRPGKMTALRGRVTLLEMGNVVGLGPAFGSALGLPEGDAGARLGLQFVTSSLIGFATVTLDDNDGTMGGATVSLVDGGSFSGEASIADCATEPQP
jgi:hypothetical protein